MEGEIRKGGNISNEYKSEDFPASYRSFLHGDAKIQEVFTSECLHKIFQPGRLSGTRLLDFGCGPTVHKIAFASTQFSDITLAEWSEANRNELKKWLRCDKDALNWTPSLEQCASVEGFRDLDAGVAEIEDRIRKAVKKVIPCDISSKDILPNEKEEFDAISTYYCLECCGLTQETYNEAIRKLTTYLRRGGALIMATVIEGTVYKSHKTLPFLYLTEDTIKEALVNAGLELRDWFIWLDTSSHGEFKYGGQAVCYSVKV